MSDQLKLHDDLLRVAHRYRDEKGELPIFVDIEIYEYFGQEVRIIEADERKLNLYVSSRFGDLIKADLCELELRPMRRSRNDGTEERSE